VHIKRHFYLQHFVPLYAMLGMQTHNLSFCLADFEHFAGVQQACKDARVNAILCMQLLAAAAHTKEPLECTPPRATKGFQPSSSSSMSKGPVATEHQSAKAADVMPQHHLAHACWEIYQYAVSENYEFTTAAMTGLYEILTSAGDSLITPCLSSGVLVGQV